MSFMTAKEISVRLNIPLARVYELTRRGAIPVVRLGDRQLRYNPAALDEWARRGGTTEGDPQRCGKNEASDGTK